MQKARSLRLTIPQQSLHRLGLCSEITKGGQHSSPVVFPEKRNKVKGSSRPVVSLPDDPAKSNADEHIINIIGGGGDEKTDLLGYVIVSGKLVLDKSRSANASDVPPTSTEKMNQQALDAKLTSKALVWGSHMLALEDVVSVSYTSQLRHFTVHSYPMKKSYCGMSCFIKARRSRNDYRFLASTREEAIRWVAGFADQQCFVNCLPHPLVSSKKQASSELLPELVDTPLESLIKCKKPPKMLVILNPRSGRGGSSKVFHGIVEPIFKLAGFQLEVVKTTSAGHARKLASSVDFSSTCPDGIICVGGDGIVNEVLNGLLSRDNQKEGISIPLGIIPAGSDNSLVWTVLGVRDPVSAAIAIVKGGLTATDVFAVEWIQTGVIHFGMTVSYYGFVSDVLELSEKYQKRFGPLRYLVAGFHKFLCLPKYNYEIEYVPASKEDREGALSTEREVVDVPDQQRRTNNDRIPRVSSLSSIDSIMTPTRMSRGDLDTTEPSEYVRGLDPKSKRLSFGRSNVTAEPEVIHPQPPLSTTPSWRRTGSKSRTDKGWSGSNATYDNPSRSSRGNAAAHDKEHDNPSSTMSDPGPIWDAEPKWDTEPNWDVENPIELPGPSDDGEEVGPRNEVLAKYEEKSVVTKGQFVGILVCNHACRSVQSSQVAAPKAEHDDDCLDMILVRGSGRLRLLRFFLLMQSGRHISLPYVEYVKVKSVKIKSGKHTHSGCGIDGEFFPLNGQVVSSLLPEQCRLIGRSPISHI